MGTWADLDLGMTDFWSVCYTVHCAHHSQRPLCRAHPERAALLLLDPGRRGRPRGAAYGASADADARAARPGLAGLVLGWTEVTHHHTAPDLRGYVPPSCFLSFLLAWLEGKVRTFFPPSPSHTQSLTQPSRFLLSLSVCLSPRPLPRVRVGRCDAICMHWSMVLLPDCPSVCFAMATDGSAHQKIRARPLVQWLATFHRRDNDGVAGGQRCEGGTDTGQ